MPLSAPVVSPPKLTDPEIAFYQREGYLYIPAVIDRDIAATLRREVMDIMAAQGHGDRMRKAKSSADKLRQTTEYLAGTTLDRFINAPELVELASQLMMGPSTLYGTFTAVKSGGGGGRFHFHQDNQYTQFEDGMHGLNLWFALNPVTPENGCLQVVPRSHLRGTLESAQSPDGDTHRTTKFEPDEFLPVRMQPGDCLAFSRITVHGSGPNTTDDVRVGYATQWHRNDARAFFNEKWRVLKDEPRWNTGPVAQLTPPPASVDGH